MSLPRYPEYKDSGVPWIGNVPAHWLPLKVKAFADFCGGGTPSRDNLAFWNGDIPWVSPKDMKSERITGAEECITPEGLSSSSSSMVDAGRLLMVVRSGILKHTIPVAINVVPVAMNQDMKALRFSEQLVTSDFFLRWVQGLNDVLLLAWAKQGATVESIEHTYLAETTVPLPPLAEQSAIAAFLDRETGKIDALIGEQEKLLTLLAEKRQATISHAVTRGLNPNAPMKDSGLPWLGEVPAHWKVVRLKFIASVQTGIAKGKDVTGRDTVTVPYLRVANVQDGFLKLDEVALIEVEPTQVERYRLLPGDVLMNEGGDFDKLGRGAIWHGEIEDCIHQNHVFAVRPHNVRPAWLNQVTSSEYAQFYFIGRSKQSTNLASISSTNVMELPVVLPPDDEQADILDWIQFEAERFNRLESEVNQALLLLKERRSALIAAAVTGKIDVRGQPLAMEDSCS
ncbi:restriction endonuclease subunit S [Rhodanobacter sp. IGA1.0]|uniref:Restriction endonuclease subunit S n=1 Tax=Rhodanobacter sp. IGA1.0 TaxID=3158582 RepID=A0AAU7QIJ0_9GAMM